MKHLLKNAQLAMHFAHCFVIKHRTLGQSDYLQYNVIWLTLHKASKKRLEVFQKKKKKWILLKWMLYFYAGHVIFLVLFLHSADIT